MSFASQATLNASDLRQFTGSQTSYRHALSGGLVYTEGAQYLAEAGSAYCLLDAILCPQLHHPSLRSAKFQAWTLEVREDHSATLICTDRNDERLYVHPVPYTGFPLRAVTLGFANQTLYLQSEH